LLSEPLLPKQQQHPTPLPCSVSEPASERANDSGFIDFIFIRPSTSQQDVPPPTFWSFYTTNKTRRLLGEDTLLLHDGWRSSTVERAFAKRTFSKRRINQEKKETGRRGGNEMTRKGHQPRPELQLSRDSSRDSRIGISHAIFRQDGPARLNHDNTATSTTPPPVLDAIRLLATLARLCRSQSVSYHLGY
jgi:hypothetical protein